MKPMLAATVLDTNTLAYPLLASPKFDGVRALVIEGAVYSRNMKPIRNAHVQALFGRLEGLDGELIVGEPSAHDCYRQTVSGVMSAAGKPAVRFFVFDTFKVTDTPYYARYDSLTKVRHPLMCRVAQRRIADAASLAAFEQMVLNEGYEGVMLRSADGHYKRGRSTLREQGLMKLKRFCDAEATVTGYEEKMHNGNESVLDELGRTKRSSHKAGKSGKGVLGALVCRTTAGITFNIGTGFDDQLASELWQRRASLPGRTVKYKFFPSGGSDKAPRFPVFLGFRQGD